MSKENKGIEKANILPKSKLPVAKGSGVKPIVGPKYDAKRDIQKYGLTPVETFEYKDPFTGTLKSIVIDRRGTTDEKVALALLDSSMPREQKDTAISMYLFEQGKQGASMLMDLWMYKGAHTKESRAFHSTMRYDFTLFLQTFQTFMEDSADLIFNSLPLKTVQVETEVNGKKVTKDVVQLTRNIEANEIALALGDYARYHRMTSTLLGKRIAAEVEKREKAKGKGIYLSSDGKPYSIHEDGDIVDVVQKDKEAADQEKHESDE